MSENSRYRLLNQPELPPAVDWITRTSVGPFIDTGVDIGRAQIERGRLYLAVSTIEEMASIAGILYPADPEDVQIKIQQAYDRGHAAGVKENLSGTFSALVDQLVLAADTLDDSRLGSGDEREQSGEAGDGAGEPDSSLSGAAGAGQGAASEPDGAAVDTPESIKPKDKHGADRPSPKRAGSRGGSRRDQLPADIRHVEPLSI